MRGRPQQSLAWKRSMENLWEEQSSVRCLSDARRIRGHKVPLSELVGGFNILVFNITKGSLSRGWWSTGKGWWLQVVTAPSMTVIKK